MPKATIQTSAGLFPPSIYEIGLQTDAVDGFLAWVGYREPKTIAMISMPEPTAENLTLILSTAHGLSPGDAQTVSNRLFESIDDEDAAQPTVGS